jgi:hypothetical protein
VVLSVRTCREYLNLSASLSSYIFTLDSLIAGAYISLMDRMNVRRSDSLSFCDDLAM